MYLQTSFLRPEPAVGNGTEPRPGGRGRSRPDPLGWRADPRQSAPVGRVLIPVAHNSRRPGSVVKLRRSPAVRWGISRALPALIGDDFPVSGWGEDASDNPVVDPLDGDDSGAGGDWDGLDGRPVSAVGDLDEVAVEVEFHVVVNRDLQRRGYKCTQHCIKF